jgi:hypothetical protein
MWNLFNCYLSGRHDYGMWCADGAIFLRCVHCGKRSSGWAVTAKPVVAAPRASVVRTKVALVKPAPAMATVVPRVKTRVLPFGRAAAAR